MKKPAAVPIGLLIVLLILVPVLVLFLLDGSFVQDVILIPVEYWIWLSGLAIRALPQYIFWGILCGLILIIGLHSLLAGKPQPSREVRVEDMRTRSQRVAFWATQIRMRQRGNYSRLRFAEFFSKLILDILAYTGQVSQADVDEALKAGTLDLPSELLSFLKNRTTRLYDLKSPGFFAGIIQSIGRVFKPKPARPGQARRPVKTRGAEQNFDDPELESAIKYLEHELEVNSNPYGDR